MVEACKMSLYGILPFIACFAREISGNKSNGGKCSMAFMAFIAKGFSKKTSVYSQGQIR